MPSRMHGSTRHDHCQCMPMLHLRSIAGSDLYAFAIVAKLPGIGYITIDVTIEDITTRGEQPLGSIFRVLSSPPRQR